MELVRFNPGRNFFSLMHPFNSVFNDIFSPSGDRDKSLAGWNWNPKVDIYDDKENIVVKAELPGVAKEDIVVDVKDRVLTLKGESTHDNEVKEENYYRRERGPGCFERAFTLPEDVNPDSINAEYKDGILTVTIPKPEKQKPRQVTVH